MNHQSIHPGAQIDPAAKIDESTIIGANCQVGPQVVTSVKVSIGKDTRILGAVTIGPCVIIGPGVTLVGPLEIKADVQIGANAVIGVEITAGSSLQCGLIGKGAHIGEHAIVLGKLSIGEFALVRPGARLAGDLPPHAAAAGCPAALVDFICECGQSYAVRLLAGELYLCICPACQSDYRLSKLDLDKRGRDLLPGQQAGEQLPPWADH